MNALWLAGSVLFSTFMIAFFKEVPRRNWNLKIVLSTNYLVCLICGLIFANDSLRIDGLSPSFFYTSFILGGLFVANFFLMGTTARLAGVAYSAVVFRISLVIPVLFSLFWYEEKMHAVNVAGLVFAIAAILLINHKDRKTTSVSAAALLPGLALFFSAGTTDSTFKIISEEFPDTNPSLVATVAFAAALLVSIPPLLYRNRNSVKAKRGSLVGGLILGLFNFFAFLCFVMALRYFEGPLAFPVNSIGSLAGAAGIGILAYRERFSLVNYLGMMAAVVGIILLLWDETWF